MSATIQLDLFGQIDSDLSSAERQQADWTAWLQDDHGRWCCPACGDHVATPEALSAEHGWTADLAEIGHPYFYSWPGHYAEGGYSGNGGRCKRLRLEWLDDRYKPAESAEARAVEDVVASL